MAADLSWSLYDFAGLDRKKGPLMLLVSSQSQSLRERVSHLDI
jgi:hypothetical protein